jgi:plastocyanin
MDTVNLAQDRPLTWRSLLVLAGVANLSVLLFMGFVQRDTLALALAGFTLVGLALSRLRGGLAGLILLGLLFTDIAIWTVSGAVDNFLHRENILALLLPSYLGVISLVGLAATAGALISWRKGPAGSGLALTLGGAGVTLLMVLTVASLFVNKPGTGLPQGEALELGSKSMLYTSSELATSAGEVTLTLTNEDLWWHTFTIDELDVDLNVPMGAERSVTFNAPAGEYRFYCGIPGHEAIGMHGTLIVSE